MSEDAISFYQSYLNHRLGHRYKEAKLVWEQATLQLKGEDLQEFKRLTKEQT